MIWYVLYKLPDRYGLISKRHNKEQIAIDGKGGLFDSEASEGNAVETFLHITKEEDNLLSSIMTGNLHNSNSDGIRRTDNQLFH